MVRFYKHHTRLVITIPAYAIHALVEAKSSISLRFENNSKLAVELPNVDLEINMIEGTELLPEMKVK